MARYDGKTAPLSGDRGATMFESGGSGRFVKMGKGKDGIRDGELDEGGKSGREREMGRDGWDEEARVEIPLSVLVTRTVEVESESLEEEGEGEGGEDRRFNVADQDFFRAMLESLDRRLEA